MPGRGFGSTWGMLGEDHGHARFTAPRQTRLMNHIYLLVWNGVTRAWVAVAEITRGCGKRSGATAGRSRRLKRRLQIKAAALAALLPLSGAPVWALDMSALPTGGKLSAGSATISQASNVLTVQQSSQRTVLNWQSFNIGAAATVNFNQPTSSAVALNLIGGVDPSQIYGKLNANGQVFFSNPNGMIFARGSQINVGGLLATTLNLSSADFMAGNYLLSKPGGGGIINDGSINASGGIALVGNSVQNTGSLIATTVSLAAGNTVAIDLSGDGLIRARVIDAALQAAIENSGSITAAQVTLSAGQARNAIDSVVNNSGVIRATGLSNQGGQIVLEGGTVLNSGNLDVASETGRGGMVSLLGVNVGITGGGSIDASGATGGGTILVGGDTQGSNPDVPNARVTYFGPQASLKADATQNGDGGKIIVWADDTTRAYGSISARGGPSGGGGGFVETSGHTLEVGSAADLSAPQGRGGTWLLDPNDISVVASSGTLDLSVPNFTANANSSTISNTFIQAALAGGSNVVLDTGASGTQAGTIALNAPITAAVTGSGTTLTLKAANSIAINQPLTSTGAALNLILDHGAAGTATLASSLYLAGGNVDVQSAHVSGTGTLNVSSGTTSLSGSLAAGQLSVSGGSTSLSGATNVTSLTMSGGTLNLNSATGLTSLALNAGTLNTAGALTAGTLTLSSYYSNAILGGGGSLTVTGASTFLPSSGGYAYLYLNGTTLNTQGAVSQIRNGGSMAYLYQQNGATINNTGIWTLDAINVQDAGGQSWQVNSFNNLGTSGVVNVAAGGGTIGTVFNNSSAAANSLNIAAGSLTLSGSGSLSVPTNLASGAGLNFSGTSYNLSGATAITGTGNLSFASGTQSIAGTVAASNLTMSGATTNLNGAMSVPSLTLNGGTLNLNNAGPTSMSTLALTSGTLNTAGALTAGTLTSSGYGSATLSGTGSYTITGASTFAPASGGYDYLYVNGTTLNTQGTVAQTKNGSSTAYLYVQNGGTINNSGTWTLDALTVSDYGGTGSNRFNNNSNGVINVAAGGGTIGTVFNNSSAAANSLNIAAGTLSLSGSGSLSVPTAVANGAGLSFSGNFNLSGSTAITGTGNLTFASGTQSIAGTVAASNLTMSGATTNLNGAMSVPSLSINSGTLNLNNAGATGVTSLAMTYGTLNSTGPLTAGTLSISGYGSATLGGTGGYTVTGATTFAPTSGGYDYLYLNGTSLNTQGAVSQTKNGSSSAYLYLQNGATINNSGTWTLDALSILNYGSGSNSFNNTSGVVNVSAGGGTISTAFNNSSPVANSLNIAAGTLTLSGSGSLSVPTAVAGGAALSFSGTTYTLSGSSAITGTGNLSFASGTQTIAGAVAAGSLTMSGGNATLAGVLSVPSLTLNGGTLALNNADATTSVNSLALNSGTLSTAGALNVGTLTMTGNGTSILSGSGAKTVSGALNFLPTSGAYPYLYVNGTTLYTQGTVAQTKNGTSQVLVQLMNGATVNNTGTWTLDGFNITSSGTGPNTFNNSGTGQLTVSGTGATIGSVFNNSNGGSVNGTAGSLALSGGSSFDASSSLAFGSGATLNFAGGSNTVTGTVNGTGALTFSGGTNTVTPAAGSILLPSSLTVSGGTSTVTLPTTTNWTPSAVAISSGSLDIGTTTISSSSWTQSGGTFGSGGATIPIGGSLVWNGGTLNGALTTVGNTTVSSGNFQLGSGATWNNSGAVTITSGGWGYLASNAIWNNSGTVDIGSNFGVNFNGTSGAQFNNLSSGTVTLSGIYSSPITGAGGNFSNAGTLNKTTATTQTLVNLNNSGTVNLNAGSMAVSGTTTNTSGAVINVNAGTLTLTGDAGIDGTLKLASGTGLTLAGSIKLSGGSFIGAAGTAPVVTASGAWTLNNANALVFDNVVVNHGNTTTQGFLLGAPSLVTLQNGAVINNTGTWTMNNASFTQGVGALSSFNNGTGGVINVPADGSLAFFGVVNSYTPAIYVSNTGMLDISGTSYLGNLTNSGTIQVLGGGSGTVSGDVVNDGTISITGTGNFQRSLTNSSTGTINLAGTLNATLGTTNAGTVITSGTSLINNLFNNNASLTVSSGTLTLSGGGSGSGAINLASTSSLILSGGVLSQTGATAITAAGGGSLTVSGGISNLSGTVAVASLTLNGGTLNLNNSAATSLSTLALNYGTLSTAGALNVGTLTMTGNGTSTLSGSGVKTVSGALSFLPTTNAYPYLYVSGTTLNTQGTVAQTKNGTSQVLVQLMNGATVNNTGTWTLDGFNITSSGTGTNTFNNSGAGRINVLGAGASIGAVFNNSAMGTGAGVNLSAGALTFSGGGSSAYDASAPLAFASGTTLNFAGGSNTVTGTVNGTGALTFSGGTNSVTPAAGSILLPSSLTVSGGTSTVTLPTTANWTPSAVAISSGSLDIGTTTISSSSWTQIGGTFGSGGATIPTGGSLVWNGGTINGPLTTVGNTTVSSGNFQLGSGATWNNSGTVTITSSGWGYLASNAIWNNTGTVNIGNAFAVNFNGTSGAQFNNQSGGTVSLTGTWATPISGTGGVFNNTGILNKNSATAQTLDSTSSNTGTINVTTGSLGLNGISSSGVIALNSGTGLVFSGGSNNITGLLNGTGALTFSGGTNTVTPTTGSTLSPSAISVTNGSSSVTMPGSTIWAPATVSITNGSLDLGAMIAVNTPNWSQSGGTASVNGLINIPALTLSGGTLNLNNAGTHSVTSLALNGGTLSTAGALNIGSLTMTGNGSSTLTGAGVNTVAGALTFLPTTNAFPYLYINGTTLNTQGAVSQTKNGGSSVNLYVENGGTINNTGTWTMDALSIINYGGTGSNSFNNTSGVVNVAAGGGTIGTVFNNSSAAANSLNIAAGSLTLSGSGSLSVPTNLASGAGLNFSGTSYNLSGATAITGTGNLSFASGTQSIAGTVAASSLTMSGATTNLNGAMSVPSLTLNSGTLTLNNPGATAVSMLSMTSGTLNAAGAFTVGTLIMPGYGNASLGGAGSYTVTGATTFLPSSGGYDYLYVNGTTLNTQGAVSQTKNGSSNVYLYVQNGGTINNTGTWSLDALNIYTSGSGINSFNNSSGVINVATGGGTISTVFNNSSVAANSLNIAAGTLTLSGSGSLSVPTAVANGAGLSFSGNFNLSGSTAITGTGNLSFVSGTQSIAGTMAASNLTMSGGTTNLNGAMSVPNLNINGGTLNLNNAGATGVTSLAMTYGTLNSTGPLTAGTLSISGYGSATLGGTGGYTVTGASTFAPASGGYDYLYLNGTTLNTQGTVAQTKNGSSSAYLYVQNGATINNTGTWTLDALNIYASGSGINSFNNTSGSVNLGAGSGTIATTFNNSGSLNLNGYSMTISGAANLKGGTLSGGSAAAGTLSLTNSLNFIGPAATVLDNIVINNSGAATQGQLWSNAPVTLQNGAIVNNSGTWTMNNASISQGSGAVSSFNNTSTGTVSIPSGGSATFTNVNINNLGTLSAIGNLVAGSLTNALGATLDFSGSTVYKMVTNNGTMQVSGGGTGTISGDVINNNLFNVAGTANLNGSLSNSATGSITLSSGKLSVAGALNQAGTVNLTGGSLTVLGSTTLTGGLTLANAGSTAWLFGPVNGGTSGQVTLSAGSLYLHGDAAVNSLTISGGTLGSAGTISIPTGGILNWSGGTIAGSTPATLSTLTGSTANVTGGTLGANSTWNNSGTLNVAPATWTNSGTLNLLGGDMNLNGSFNAANLFAFSRAPGSTVNLTGSLDNSGATLDIGSAGQFGAGGLSSLSGTIKGGTLVSNSGALLNSSGGTLDGVTIGSNLASNSGNLYFSNGLTLAGGVTATNNGSWWLNGASGTQNIATSSGNATIQMNGTSLLTNNTSAINSETVAIASGITLQGSGILSNYNYAQPWINNGAIIANTPGQTLTLASSINSLSNNGLLAASAGALNISASAFTQSGTVKVASGATVTRSAGFTNSGTLSGSGTLAVGTGSAALINQGNIDPGSSAAAGTLSITGDLQLGSSSVLNMKLGGAAAGLSDKLAVSGSIFTGGILNASLLTGYTPANNDAIALMTMAGTASGNFANASLPSGFSAGYNLSAGEAVRLIYSGSGAVVFTNAGGTLDWATPANWSSGALPGSASSALISSGLAVTHGSGTDNIAALTISSGNSLNISGGSLSVSTTASLGGGLSVSGGSATFTGGLSGATTGQLSVSAGTLTLGSSSSITSLNVSGGTLNGPGAITIPAAGTLNWSGGSINGTTTSYLITQSGATSNVTGGTLGANRIWNNSGTLNVTPATWVNQGTLNLVGGDMNLNGSFTGADLFAFSRATGSTVNLAGSLDNTGKTLNIGGTGPFGTGGLAMLSGRIFNGTVVSNDGTILSGSNATLDGVTLGGTTLTTSGNFTINNSLSLASGVTVNMGNSAWNFGSTAYQHIATSGSATINDAGGSISAGATGQTLQIDAGITLQGNGTLASSSPAALINAGTINVASADVFSASAGFTNAGTLSGSGTFVVGRGAAGLINQGNINPGGTGTAGTLTITGDLQLGSGSVLNMKLAGTGAGQYDKLAVSGAVSGNAGVFGGLSLTRLGSYSPASGDSFQLMSAGSGIDSGGFSAISLSRVSLTPSYAASSFNLAAAPMVLSITADSLSKIYGNADPTLSYSATGFDPATGDTVANALSGLLGRAPGTNVGAYAINQGSLISPLGYAINVLPGSTLSIVQRSLAITAANQNVSYGSALIALTYSVGGLGLVNGDTLAGSLTTTATPGSDVIVNQLTGTLGGYPISQGTLAANPNYAVSFTPGLLTIQPLTVSLANLNNYSQVYGNVQPSTSAFGITFNNGLANADFGNGALAASLQAVGNGLTVTNGSQVPTLPVGNYTLSVTALGGAKSMDYILSTTGNPTATFGITPRPITVNSIGSVAKTYDGTTSAAVGNAVMSNVVNNDLLGLAGIANYSSANVGSNLTVSLSSLALSGSAAGNYSIASAPVATTGNSISQLASVAWTGASTGNWSNPANWAGGALPVLANVAKVSIPAGVSVIYDSAAGATQLASLTSLGNLSLAGGSLTLGNTAADASRIQNATLDLSGATLTVNGSLQADVLRIASGTLNGTGNLISADYAQTGGALGTLGNLTLASVGNLNLTSSLAATQSIDLSSGGNILDATIGSAATLVAPSIKIRAATGIGSSSAPLRLATALLSARTTTGTIQLSNTSSSAVTLTGLSTGDASNISYAQNGQVLDVAGSIVSSGGAILIDPPTDLTMSSIASISSGGGGIALQASGNVTLAAVNAGSGNVSIQTSGGTIASAIPGANNVTAGKLTLAAPGNVQIAYSASALDISGVLGTLSLTANTPVDSLIVAITTAASTLQSVQATAASPLVDPIVQLGDPTGASAPLAAGEVPAAANDPTAGTATALSDSARTTSSSDGVSYDKPAVTTGITTVIIGTTLLQKPSDQVLLVEAPKGRMLVCRP